MTNVAITIRPCRTNVYCTGRYGVVVQYIRTYYMIVCAYSYM